MHHFKLNRTRVVSLMGWLVLVLASHAQALPGSEKDLRAAYVLGPEDQITIRALDVEEISDKPISIDTTGFINLPMVGRLRAAGLTAQQLEAELNKRLKAHIRNPNAAVSVTEFRSQPVSIIGAVNAPGVQQIRSRKTLVEMLSLAGGLRPDAGYNLKISRRLEWGPIPLPTATTDQTGSFSVAEVNLKTIMEATHPEENILVRPDDVISVPRAQVVYVIGDVHKSGAFILNDRENLSVLEALSLAEGLDREAAPRNSKILRAKPGSPDRTEIPVDLKKTLEGKSPDLAMQAEDILFIPGSASKKAALRALEAVIQAGTGVLIYRR